MAFDLYYFSKMDEVHIIPNIYMDEGIPCLYQCLNIQIGIKALTIGADQYIQLEVHNGGLNGRLNTNTGLKNWYIETMAFFWNAISK